MRWRGFGFVHRSRTLFCRAVPNPNLTIRNFFIAVKQQQPGLTVHVHLSRAASVRACGSEPCPEGDGGGRRCAGLHGGADARKRAVKLQAEFVRWHEEHGADTVRAQQEALDGLDETIDAVRASLAPTLYSLLGGLQCGPSLGFSLPAAGGEQQTAATPQAARGWTPPPCRHFKIQSCCCLGSAFEVAAFQFQASPRSQAATAELLGNLNRVTASGTIPTFESAGARSGYVHKRQLRRAEKIGAAFLSLEAAEAFAAPALCVDTEAGAEAEAGRVRASSLNNHSTVTIDVVGR